MTVATPGQPGQKLEHEQINAQGSQPGQPGQKLEDRHGYWLRSRRQASDGVLEETVSAKVPAVMVRRYKWKLYESDAVFWELDRQRKMVVDVHNALLEFCERTYEARKEERHGIYYCRRTEHRYVTDRPWSAERKLAARAKVAATKAEKLARRGGTAAGSPKPTPPRPASGPPLLPSFQDLTAELTRLRRECPEIQALPTVTMHRIADSVCGAFKAYFNRLKKITADPALEARLLAEYRGHDRQPTLRDLAGYPRYHNRRRGTGIPLGVMGKTGWKLVQQQDNPRSWRLHYGSLTDVRKPDTWIHCRNKLKKSITVVKWLTGDLLYEDGHWWLSVCAETKPRRTPGTRDMTVAMDLLDCFALVDNVPEEPPGIRDAQLLQDDLDARKSECDLRWPPGKRRKADEQESYQEAREEISRLSAKLARVRANALHVWSDRVVRRASSLTIKRPSVKRYTKTPRGTEKHWGANVAPVSELNRNTLSQAPAMAVAMLKYKAEEAGIHPDIVEDDASKLAVGAHAVAKGRELRRISRQTKQKGAQK